MMDKCKCSECECLWTYRKEGNIRTQYYCEHKNQSYIGEYFRKHRIAKMEGFLGHGKNGCPVKTAPKWCPKMIEDGERHGQN